MAAEPVAETNFQAEFWKHLYRQLLGGPARALTRLDNYDGFVCDVSSALRQAMPRSWVRISDGALRSEDSKLIPHNDLLVNWPLEPSPVSPDVRRYSKFLMDMHRRNLLHVTQVWRLDVCDCAHVKVLLTEAEALDRIKELTKNDLVKLVGLPDVG